MPCYVVVCENTACPEHGKRVERFARAEDRCRLVCPGCKRQVATHPDQFSGVAVQRTWARGRDGIERKSKAMVFQEAGIPEIKRDCPSMDFEVRDGEATPIFHNDAHHRKVMKELSGAKKRYEDERDAKKVAAKARSKSEFLRARRKKAGTF